MEQILVVANANAGTHEQEAMDAALGVLRRVFAVEVRETSRPSELDDVLGAAGTVVVAGGDGSLHAVANALHRLGRLGSVRLGLLPLGTGNDFARGVGVPLDPCEAAEVIAAGHTRPTDLLVADDDVVIVNNVHLGVGAQASRAASKWKARLGRFGYLVGAIGAGLKPDFIRVNVTVDGEDLMPGGRVAQVAIGNGPAVGGGTELIPGADTTSGHLLVIVSKTIGPLSRLVYLARLKGGSHYLMKEVSRVRGQQVTVEGGDFWLTSDGELSGPHRRRTWRVVPGAVDMFLPEVPDRS
ncbi:MAG TPA: diacylglycerol kinase family protein [Marmoricola sp.]|nr:diacylglycerol kinase family protein [Marmoricola sp.]